MFAVSILLFVTGWLAPEVTGLLAAALLVAFKVLKPDQAVQGFGSPALITLMGLFAVSAGLFSSGGLDRLRAMIAFDLIRSPRRLIVLKSAVVSPISGFIPNTPIVATLLPVLEVWCQRRRISPSRVLLPMDFAVVLGGTISLRRIGAPRVIGGCFREAARGPLGTEHFIGADVVEAEARLALAGQLVPMAAHRLQQMEVPVPLLSM